MRGVLSRGRRPPANRPAKPAGRRWVRQPCPTLAAWPRGRRRFPPPARPCPEGRPRGTTRGSSTRWRAALERARGTRVRQWGSAPRHPAPDWDNDSGPGTSQPPVTSHRHPVPPAFRRERRPPRPLAALLLPAGRHGAAAGPAASRAVGHAYPPIPAPRRYPARARIAGRAGPYPGAASCPVRPLSATAARGRGHYLTGSADRWPGWSAPRRNRLRAGSVSLPATRRNQLPGLSLCSQSPVTD